jgi:F0F1-type ATP synthase delta subunit
LDLQQRKNEMMTQTKQEVKTKQTQWQQEIKKETSLFMDQLKELISKEATSLARLTLRDLAGASLESMVFDVFAKKLENLDDQDQSKLISALKKRQKITFLSAFDITDQQKSTIESVLSSLVSDPIKITYGQDPNLICGMLLEIEGYRIMWNIEHYLEKIETKIMDQLSQAIKG